MLTRLWYLQVLSPATEYSAEAQTNRLRWVYTEAPRGRILDRQGRVLVDNEVVPAVLVDRSAVEKSSAVKVRLAALLGLSIGEIDDRLADQRFSPFKPVPVADEVPKDVLLYLGEHQAEFPGVQAVQRTRRSYPHGTLAAQALGYVGEINDRELCLRQPERTPRTEECQAQRQEERADHGKDAGAAGQGTEPELTRRLDYRAGDGIGKSGLELAYEDDLRGKPQIERLEVDSQGRVLRTLSVTPAVPGNDLLLSIDLDIQRVAEESLEQGLVAARTTFDNEQAKRFLATAGSAVVLDPRDGSILAMVSAPTYDPRQFVDGIAATTFRELQDPKGRFPLNNRAIQGQYPPGSTFKLATALAGLNKGLVGPRDTVDDTGSIRIGNPPRVFRNALGKAHGRIDLPQAIAVSSDVYFYRIGQRFWEGRATYGQTAIQESARALGLGMVSGVELPYEVGGRIPDPETRKRLNQQNPTAFPTAGWFTGDNVNLSIGQGEMVVTPLQVAVAYATFANGGTVYATRLGRSVRAADGKEIRPIPSRVVRRIDLAASVRGPMLSGFEAAVSSPKGTAYGAFTGFPLGQIRVAGKTGTSQAPPLQDTALFVGFAPVQAPQYVVAVVMEEAGFGSVAAAPVARRILESAFGLGVQPVKPGQGTE